MSLNLVFSCHHSLNDRNNNYRSRSQQSEISLADLAQTELILLDEGDHSLTRTAFVKENIVPTFTYEIYDNYTILEMIRQGLGVSLLYENFLDGLSLEDLAVRQISENPFRTVVLAWKKIGRAHV